MNDKETVVTVEVRIPNFADTWDLDAMDELRRHVRGLEEDPEFLATMLGCEPGGISRDVDARAHVVFHDVAANGQPVRY